MTGDSGRVWNWLERDLEALARQDRLRNTRRTSGTGTHILLDGIRVLNLCSNDYLGLTRHPDVVAAALEATKEHGTGTASSRLIAGTNPLHEAFEATIAKHKQADSALVFGSGTLANLGAIPALAGQGDLILSDALNHASIVDGCRMSRATVEVYPHKDHEAVVQRLEAAEGQHRRILVVTDGLFSMDGDLADLGGLRAACRENGAMLYVDDAHATGVLGTGGRGSFEHLDVSPEGCIQMGTMSKALGSEGGFVAGPAPLRDVLLNRARPFIFSTAPSPATMAAAAAALAVVGREPERRRRLLTNADLLRRALADLGLSVPAGVGPILPVILGSEQAAMRTMHDLLEQGIYAAAIRPPTVPPGACRIRLTVQSGHDSEELEAAAHTIAKAASAADGKAPRGASVAAAQTTSRATTPTTQGGP